MILRCLPTLLVLAVSLVSPTVVAEPDKGAEKAIVSFVSPGHLFPVEGTAFHHRSDPTASETYRPLTAYDKVGGSRIGEVKMADPACVGASTEPRCDQGHAWDLELLDGSRRRLQVGEHSYETNGLLSYVPGIQGPGGVWSQIESSHGPFWVVTPPEEVIPFEQLVHVIERFDRWCESPGVCTPVSREMAAEVRKIDEGQFQLAGCYQHAYEVTGIVSAGGERYYQVSVSKVEEGSREPRLPKSSFIPVRNLDGSHTGTFYSRGC
jgi:hypothetical protein